MLVLVVQTAFHAGKLRGERWVSQRMVVLVVQTAFHADKLRGERWGSQRMLVLVVQTALHADKLRGEAPDVYCGALESGRVSVVLTPATTSCGSTEYNVQPY